MTPHSILIIDDDEQLRTFLRRVLEQAGYLVVDASNGQAGLLQFRQTPTTLVITDLFMPERDGLEVTMALRRDWPQVKIIVLTDSSGGRNLLDAATLLGAHRTMKKPITIAHYSKPWSRSYRTERPTKKMHGKRSGDRRSTTGIRCGSLLTGFRLVLDALATDSSCPVSAGGNCLSRSDIE